MAELQTGECPFAVFFLDPPSVEDLDIADAGEDLLREGSVVHEDDDG